MEASIGGFDPDGLLPKPGHEESTHGCAVRTAAEEGAGTTAADPPAGALSRRLGTCAEHALFAVTLGTLGYIWLGALLAEAAQGL